MAFILRGQLKTIGAIALLALLLTVFAELPSENAPSIVIRQNDTRTTPVVSVGRYPNITDLLHPQPKVVGSVELLRFVDVRNTSLLWQAPVAEAGSVTSQPDVFKPKKATPVKKMPYKTKPVLRRGMYASRGDSPKRLYSFIAETTAYKGNSKRQGTGDRTSLGMDADGYGFAVDPNMIPLGSWLKCPAWDAYLVKHGREPVGWKLADDTGRVIKGRKVDLRMKSERDCDNWGRRNALIEVWIPR